MTCMDREGIQDETTGRIEGIVDINFNHFTIIRQFLLSCLSDEYQRRMDRRMESTLKK